VSSPAIVGVNQQPTRVVTPAGAAFGPNEQITTIPAAAFHVGADGYGYTMPSGNSITPLETGTGPGFFAPLRLPNGAVVGQIDILVEDVDEGLEIGAYLYTSCFPISESVPPGAASIREGTSLGLAGVGTISLAGNDHTIRSQGFCLGQGGGYQAYLSDYLAVYLSSTGHTLYGAVVHWRRSVSPAPDTATFGDVPTDDPFFQFVEALAASGVTAGCGAGNYCPNEPATRAQMATFLAKALGLHWPD
jgi:hypothetical protein